MKHNSVSRRDFLKWSAMASGALALAACAPAGAPAGGEQAAAGGEAAPATEGNVVSYWYNWSNLEDTRWRHEVGVQRLRQR